MQTICILWSTTETDTCSRTVRGVTDYCPPGTSYCDPGYFAAQTRSVDLGTCLQFLPCKTDSDCEKLDSGDVMSCTPVDDKYRVSL